MTSLQIYQQKRCRTDTTQHGTKTENLNSLLVLHEPSIALTYLQILVVPRTKMYIPLLHSLLTIVHNLQGNLQGFPKLTNSCIHFPKMILTSADLKKAGYK